MTDVLIYENGTGGEMLIRNGDTVVVDGLENSLYLAMFGGSDWVLNDIITDNQYQCQTEKALKSNALTSAGRAAIEKAINADLSFLNDIEGTVWTVATTITNTNRLDIAIDVNGQIFYYQWNPDSMYLKV